MLFICIYQIFQEYSLIIQKKFINSRYFVDIVDTVQREKRPPICWENLGKNNGVPIHFDGVSYIFLGNRDCQWQWHQGRDHHITKKQKNKETRKDLVRGVDHMQHKYKKVITTFKET